MNKKYPIFFSAGKQGAGGGKVVLIGVKLDSEALLQAVHLFCGVL
ncbi:hypothetical protein ACOWPH_29465 (plasmid) [Anabaena sp. PCC 7938]|uniref:Uncharacterized protein n=1 Tax=Anabaena cylindrica (strain ATCC 27899 / PCC 7122) TaxID=272123 RepID=K9ZPR3_ANACC|nr:MULTISPECIES: hypothetical protein [Anabaena]AFZ61198.1 hypothetical protein Anacy_5908 [Anabaena cylindrica PCC 7122]BAY06654.1 hypothetical protein NIES19_59370 [Anabaena cylindrica PCC 7122]